MSKNAFDAYSEGRKPISRITLEDIVECGVETSLAFFIWFVKKHCSTSEWHHTSPKFNQTLFYDIKECCEKLNNSDIEALKVEYTEYNKALKQKKEPNNKNNEYYYAKVDYSVSTLSGKRYYYSEYAIIHKSWAHITAKKKKSINGGRFEIVKKYKRRPSEMSKEISDAILKKLKLK